MSIAALIAMNRGLYRPKNRRLVQDWWPKPTITSLPEKYWGDRWTNGDRLLHKYKCSSFSTIGFHSNKKQLDGLPDNVCFAYGESPEQAYDQWCELFNVWNKKDEWVK